MQFELAAKCAPKEDILLNIERAGIRAVELFLSKDILNDFKNIVKICKKFHFRYAVHSPNDYYNPDILADFVTEINSEILTFHDIFWEDEWIEIINRFKNIKTKLCVENIGSVYDSSKFIRRFGFGRCLDIEHMQFEIFGVYEEELINLIKESSHIHLTGYYAGSNLWHTHIHESREHCYHLLDLIKKADYKGMVVSEARVSLQTYEEFIKLKRFYDNWLINQSHN